MIGIKTEKIKLNDTPATISLAKVFERARDVLQQENKIPIRMILLDRKRKQCDLLVSFIYDTAKK